MKTNINLLPAILVAGPPNSGKSVLAYLLSHRLREARVPHILLRAAPDGEGDWFYESPDETRYLLRQKGEFSPQLVQAMRRAIEQRMLPMLVDIGGLPRDDQFNWFDACSHVIHLYQEEDDRWEWGQWLEARSLIPIAELHSQLQGPDTLLACEGLLRGIISALDREHPQPGPTFEQLLDRVQGICTYKPDALEGEHLRHAPDGAEVIIETALAHDLGIARPGQRIWWQPEHLEQLREYLPSGSPIALYGSGPVWLTAAVAALTSPAPFYVFDARHYGWMAPPAVILNATQANEEFELTIHDKGDHIRLRFDLRPAYHVLTPQTVLVPAIPADRGVILDGRMPKWLWAALARALCHHPWLAAYEPRDDRIVVFWGKKR